MKALVKLAEASDLKAEIERMFTGEKINATENRAVLHTALRNCDPQAKVMVDGRDVMPDVLVKGGDYKIEDIVGRENAGQTVTIPFEEGFSTTNIINRSRQ